MKLLKVAALVAACAMLSGCVTPMGRAAVGELNDIEVRMKPKVSCSDLVSRITGADADGTSVAQVKAIYQACEEMQRGVVIKPEAARALGMPGL